MTRKWATISQNLAFVLSSTGFQAICSLAALTLNARALGASAFGTLAIIQAYTSLIATVTTFETWQAVVRIGTGSRRRLGPTLAGGMLLDGAAAMAATLIALGGILLFAPTLGIDEPVRILAAIYSLSLLFGLTGTPKGYLRLIGRHDILAFFQAAHAFAALAVSVILFSLHASLPAYVAAFAALEAIYGLAVVVKFLALARPQGLSRPTFLNSPRARLHLVRITRMATSTSLLGTLMSGRRQLTLIVAASTLSASATGLFAFAARLANVVQRVSTAVNQIVFPEMIAVSTWPDRRAALRLVMGLTAFAIAASGSVTALVYAFDEAIVVLAGGEEFRPAADLFVLLFASECVALAAIPLHGLIQGLMGVRPLLAVTCVSLVLFVVLATLLVASLGGYGVALASLIASIFAYVGAIAWVTAGLRLSPGRSEKAADLS